LGRLLELGLGLAQGVEKKVQIGFREIGGKFPHLLDI